jgi:hypothetical protein
MARGDSGRIVIEVDPAFKRELYATLAISGSTLKDWFVKAASRYCTDAMQPDLFGEGSAPGGGDLFVSEENDQSDLSSPKK